MTNDVIWFDLFFLLSLWYLVRSRQESAPQTATNGWMLMYLLFDDAPLCFAINWKYSFIEANLLDLKLSLKSFCARFLRFTFIFVRHFRAFRHRCEIYFSIYQFYFVVFFSIKVTNSIPYVFCWNFDISVFKVLLFELGSVNDLLHFALISTHRVSKVISSSWLLTERRLVCHKQYAFVVISKFFFVYLFVCLFWNRISLIFRSILMSRICDQ